MIFEESFESNNINVAHNGDTFDEEEDSDSEKDNHDDDDSEENTNAELFVRLTDMVRKHYCGYLEKQLLENVYAWRANIKEEDAPHAAVTLTAESATLQECCRLLEDRALKACMHARRYQRTMLKIIAEVRRSTQEFRLEEELRKLLTIDNKLKNTPQNLHNQKSTQTDESSFSVKDKTRRKPRISDSDGNINQSPCSLSLQQKIDMFQKRLNQETAAIVAAKTHKKQRFSKSRRHSSHNQMNDKSHVRQRRHKLSIDNKNDNAMTAFSKTSTFVPSKTTKSGSSKPSTVIMETNDSNTFQEVSEVTTDLGRAHCSATANITLGMQISVESNILDQDDEIAKELDQLFSEEKSELEELLGLSTSSQIDDPQVRSVLEEIQKAPLTHELKPTTTTITTAGALRQDLLHTPEEQQQRWLTKSPAQQKCYFSKSPSPIIDGVHDHFNSNHQNHSTDDSNERLVANMRHSLWPCELYMQRRRLTASLSRLIEEDFRWHDIMKWKFQMLFGEDSDDEFATCSPSIELDEILINSCIRRISPWIVKHLMKPMRDGLIANRFLFKKLAKRLAHSIVLENQYPDERLIKCAVEEYFCLHQAVLSLEDLADMPDLKLIEDNT